jgi:hypothetical protein
MIQTVLIKIVRPARAHADTRTDAPRTVYNFLRDKLKKKGSGFE